MTLIPHRTAANQVATELRAALAQGRWTGWLPGERELGSTLQASRNTIRAALELLKAEGLVIAVRGQGTKVLAQPALAPTETGKPKTIGVIMPGPIGSLRPLVALWIDELREQLIGEGYRLRLHAGPQYYQANPTRALERLTEQHAHQAWVLTLSSEAMQRWFARRELPCLVAGSTFPDVALPSLDLDYRAVCRHAAGVFLRAGHRRLALLNRESRRAGDLDSELGFLEGVRTSPHLDASVDVAYHRDDVETVGRALRRLLDRAQPPTGMLVSNSYAYLAASSLLAQRGLRIPHDISLISRDDDPFLIALAPAPTRYVVSPLAFAKKVAASLLRLATHEPLPYATSRLLPKYTPGGSVAAPHAER